MRGAFGTSFPIDGQYEFRWRYANLRGPVPDRRQAAVRPLEERTAAAWSLTPEQRKALDERNRLAGRRYKWSSPSMTGRCSRR
jgi:hypothetical protein